ncbi:hypothetical protein GTN66_01275, partial [bacterium]|nr:hypothetical protein [bacterium]NIO73041.1 hypothetical protein [bacterium]
LQAQDKVRRAKEDVKKLAGYDVKEDIEIDFATLETNFKEILRELEDKDRHVRILLKALGIKKETLDILFAEKASKEAKIGLKARLALGLGILFDSDQGVGLEIELPKDIDPGIQELEKKLKEGEFYQELRNIYLETMQSLQELRLYRDVLPNLQKIARKARKIADEDRSRAEKNIISQDDYLKSEVSAIRAETMVELFEALTEDVKSRLRELGMEDIDIPEDLSEDAKIHNCARSLIAGKAAKTVVYLHALKVPNKTLNNISSQVYSILEDTFLYREATNRWVLEQVELLEEIQIRLCHQLLSQKKELMKGITRISGGYERVIKRGAIPETRLTPVPGFPDIGIERRFWKDFQ